jgi:ABC-type lipoprotein export system ATPase subunit
MRAIEARDLTKHYPQGRGTVRALDGVTLTIESSEFVAVVGRSGSGKTTLLDCLGLLHQPTSGQVILEGQDVSRLSGNDRAALRGRRLGFIFQEFNLLPGLDALENVMLPLRYTKVAGVGKAEAVTLLEEVGLGDRLTHRPAQLSGGEQQRVAIARSLVNRPALVLGDEPTGEVDSETSAQLVGLMRRLNGERGVTFVLVTHDPDVASRADRVIRLQDGRVVSDERVARPETATA